MDFNYALLNWTCKCGQRARVVEVGMTSHQHLIGRWKCAKCREDMTALIPLEDLLRGIPPPPAYFSREFTAFDQGMCAEAHISLEDI